MRRALAILLATAFSLSASAALADEEDHEVEAAPKKIKETFAVEPTAGWVTGHWMGVPVTRVMAGIDALVMPSPDVPIGVDGTFFVAPGSTENGLDTTRIELGAGISSRPGVFRVLGGGHLSLAWLERKTMSTTIVGIGIGAHACIEAAIPLGEKIALTVGLRGSADLYDGGLGYEGGPFAGLRF